MSIRLTTIKAFNIGPFKSRVKYFINPIDTVRSNAKSKFKLIFSDMRIYSKLFGFEIKRPLRSTKQITRNSAKSWRKIYILIIFILLLHRFITYLNIRFISHRTVFRDFNSIFDDWLKKNNGF